MNCWMNIKDRETRYRWSERKKKRAAAANVNVYKEMWFRFTHKLWLECTERVQYVHINGYVEAFDLMALLWSRKWSQLNQLSSMNMIISIMFACLLAHSVQTSSMHACRATWQFGFNNKLEFSSNHRRVDGDILEIK